MPVPEGDAAYHAAWAPAAYAHQAPARTLGTASRLIIGVFAAALLFVAAVAMTRDSRTIAGNAMEAPGAAAAVAKTRASSDGSSSKKVQKVHELGTNPLLGAGIRLTDVTCPLPALGRSDDELRAFYEAQISCLDDAWRPALHRVGEPTIKLLLQVKVSQTSRCGQAPDSQKALAYYCAGDSTIYAPSDWMLRAVSLNKGSHLATIAHEYGHHVQNESGILEAASSKMTSDDESSPDDLERVRRIELQANCFGALFVAAAAGRGDISASTANAAIADYGNTSDSDTHGSRKHQLSWAMAGFEKKTTAACDTWSVPTSEVT
jgi:hypothetical protein